MNAAYGYEYHKNRHARTKGSASRILSLALEALPVVQSAVDLGCGVGTWLTALRERGVEVVLGIDGPWVDKRLLEIPESCFRPADLNKPIALERRYDLAISLEAAEHLEPASAKTFVASLAGAADFILFSAGIPFQGSTHLNEQWPAYWAALFDQKGYCAVDCIRTVIWDDGDIPPWYRQNTLLFVKRERASEVTVPRVDVVNRAVPMALVHPDFFLAKMAQTTSVRGCGRMFLRAVRNWAGGR
jgi:hypothetical protein